MIDFNFKFYGNIDVESIKNKLKGLNWDDYDFRQKAYSVHSRTKTVPLIWDEKKQGKVYWETYQNFKEELNIVENFLNDNIGHGEIETAILINLPSKKNIDRHYDRGTYFQSFHRVHIPIITNEKCLFEIDGEVKNLKQGEVWEINNDAKPHSVENQGEEDRIHLLIDYNKFKNN